MPACLRVAWLAGGGCASGVFGEPVWQPRGGIGQFRWQHHGGIVQFRWQHRGGTMQFRWQHRGGSYWPCRAAGPIGGVGERWSGLAWMLPGAWLWPPRGHCLPLQHSCATRSPRFDVGLPCALWPPLVAMVSLMSNGLLEYGKVMYRPAYCMHGSVALLATAWLIWCLAWPADWACYFTVVSIMGGVTVGWCASRGTPMPSFATVLISALFAGSTLSRPVTVADAVVGCLAWRPSFFSWCASKFKGAVLLCIACPGDTPFHSRPLFRWSRPSMLRGLWVGPCGLAMLLAAPGGCWLSLREPPAHSRCFGCARSWCASRYLGSRLWILISWPIGASWLCLGSSWGCWTVPRAPPWLVTLALLGFGASGPWVRVFLMALDGRLYGGCSMAGCLALPPELLAAWLLLHRDFYSV
ncbi:hypothetical protein V6N11_030905 [Hibiscus sabdariffa]|uniref:Uncharacterized protein n=1 Tax=Hibiscus sabdariffa TaxID=183260 RepID=A0ABR2NSR0_9ROSI